MHSALLQAINRAKIALETQSCVQQDKASEGCRIFSSFHVNSVGEEIKLSRKQLSCGQYHWRMLQGWPTKSRKCSDGHQSVLHWAVNAGRFHSWVSGLESWKQEGPRWDHGVELESLLATYGAAPQWMSLKTEVQWSLGLTRNIYPLKIPTCFFTIPPGAKKKKKGAPTPLKVAFHICVE